MFTTTGAVTYLWKHCCHPIDPAINPYYQHVSIRTNTALGLIGLKQEKITHFDHTLLR